ncbi:ATP-binding protein [Candidatus Woesearchaeota archaeon]|nr:ATP-binding protein [Candidatus Woesearchaeota archaeon]
MGLREHLKDILITTKGAGKDRFPDILGQEDTKRQLASALLMGRHIILAGPPGIGKTTLARSVARLLPSITANDCEYRCDPERPLCPGCRKRGGAKATKGVRRKGTREVSGEERFVRIQGSPDLTPEDLLGDIDPIKALEYGPQSVEAFTPGKIFRANRGILFFDEVNRCPEKLQNSLLQVLEEGHATVGSYDVEFPADILFIGTMNPEDSSTERLSDVFLDRFDIIYMDYPEGLATEREIVRRKGRSIVGFDEGLLSFSLDFIRGLRQDENIDRKPSVRASIGLYERAQANAALDGRDSVRFEDVVAIIVSVLAHRMSLKPSVKYLFSNRDYLKERFDGFCKSRSVEEYSETGGSL